MMMKQEVRCSRRMAIFAVFDILDRLQAAYEQHILGISRHRSISRERSVNLRLQ